MNVYVQRTDSRVRVFRFDHSRNATPAFLVEATHTDGDPHPIKVVIKTTHGTKVEIPIEMLKRLGELCFDLARIGVTDA